MFPRLLVTAGPRVAAAAFAMLILTVSGCSEASAPAPTAAPESADVPEASRAGTGAAPSSLAEEDVDFLHLAEGKLTARCMADRGQPYVEVVPEPGPEPVGFAYYNDDEKWANEHGYQINFQPVGALPTTPDANAQAVMAMPPEQAQQWNDALTGTDSGRLTVELPDQDSVTTYTDGCVASARTQLFGDLQTYIRTKYAVRFIDSTVVDRVYADPAFAAVNAAWSTCMSAVGYHFATPADARNAVGDETAEIKGREGERALAVADARCAKETNFVGVASELDEKYRAVEMANREAEVLAYDELRQEAVQRGRELLDLS